MKVDVGELRALVQRRPAGPYVVVSDVQAPESAEVLDARDGL